MKTNNKTIYAADIPPTLDVVDIFDFIIVEPLKGSFMINSIILHFEKSH